MQFFFLEFFKNISQNFSEIYIGGCIKRISHAVFNIHPLHVYEVQPEAGVACLAASFRPCLRFYSGPHRELWAKNQKIPTFYYHCFAHNT